jgi:dihydrofolate reductase
MSGPETIFWTKIQLISIIYDLVLKKNTMRKIIVLEFLTLDGVMQAPGGSEEDTSSWFKYGGWSTKYIDEVAEKVFAKLMKPADYLMGRKTFDIFASYWPVHEWGWHGINDGTKYVISKTMKKSDWKNTVFFESLADIEKLKNSEGSDIQVWGSGKLVQLLLKNDLVDELWLSICPLTLGQWQKLFEEGTIPVAFTLTESVVTPSWLIMANYKRTGEVEAVSF